jgi:hypothetical protein
MAWAMAFLFASRRLAAVLYGIACSAFFFSRLARFRSLRVMNGDESSLLASPAMLCPT